MKGWMEALRMKWDEMDVSGDDMEDMGDMLTGIR